MSIRDQVTNMLSDAKEEMMVICVRTLVAASAHQIAPGDIGQGGRPVHRPERTLNRSRRCCHRPAWSSRSGRRDPMAEFHQQLVKGKFGSFDEQYRVELLVIVDRLRSVLVYENGGERTGIVFELPLIVALQYSAIENLLLG